MVRIHLPHRPKRRRYERPTTLDAFLPSLLFAENPDSFRGARFISLADLTIVGSRLFNFPAETIRCIKAPADPGDTGDYTLPAGTTLEFAGTIFDYAYPWCVGDIYYEFVALDGASAGLHVCTARSVTWAGALPEAVAAAMIVPEAEAADARLPDLAAARRAAIGQAARTSAQ